MRSKRVRLALPALGVALAGCVLALGGCGRSASSSRSVSLAQLPLVDGASIVSQARQCDRGANAYCAIEAVIVDRRSHSSGALVASEYRRLRAHGWTGAAGDNGDERAANSPGHQLRVTYSTAAGDLIGIDLGWIKRPRAIALSLASTMFERTPAMSIMLETGPA
jgi:hypothetical protein